MMQSIATSHKLTGQVTGVRSLQRGIGQTFTSTVGRDEVLEYRETFTEGGKIGRSIISPEGFAIKPRVPHNWRTCCLLPRAPESIIR